jgi:hypothetical protein
MDNPPVSGHRYISRSALGPDSADVLPTSSVEKYQLSAMENDRIGWQTYLGSVFESLPSNGFCSLPPEHVSLSFLQESE